MKFRSRNPVESELTRIKSDGEQCPDELVEAIIKVNRAAYVPEGVRVRSRISSTMFTAELENAILEKTKNDTNVVSVSRSKKLQLIE